MNMIIEEKRNLLTMDVPDANLKDELITDIISLGMKAHRLTERCIFVEFYGHVNTLNISIRRNEHDYADELASSVIRLLPYSFYTEEEAALYEQQLIETLSEMKRYFEDAIEHGDFDIEHLLRITKRIN
jgi:hypothetical protein